MKKILIYISISVIVCGLLSPVASVHAAPYNADGSCPSGLVPNIDPNNRDASNSCITPEQSNAAADARNNAVTLTPLSSTPVSPTGCVYPQVLQNGTCVNFNSSYALLAPIKVDGGITTFNPAQPNALGAYLNQMIKITIGLAAVMAVVMIVIGGVEYMTSELIHSKEAGKQRINGAIIGLLLALGAYALLYTINPDILNSDVNAPDVTVTVMLDQETAAQAITSDNGAAPTGTTPLCPDGIQKTTSGMFACGSIAQNLTNMLQAAQAAGLTINGGGYRSPDAQTALRVQNCNGNTTDRNAVCNPPTALAGLSNHNSGLAFDLKCSGTLIQSKDNACYKWLQANASTYGLANLPSEPWHWSVDGR